MESRKQIQDAQRLLDEATRSDHPVVRVLAGLGLATVAAAIEVAELNKHHAATRHKIGGK